MGVGWLLGATIACLLTRAWLFKVTSHQGHELKPQDNYSTAKSRQRIPSGPQTRGDRDVGSRCRAMWALEGKTNWRKPSTGESWHGFLSTLGNGGGRCLLLSWLKPPLSPINGKIRAAARGTGKELSPAIIRSPPSPAGSGHTSPSATPQTPADARLLESKFILMRERSKVCCVGIYVSCLLGQLCKQILKP